MSKQLHHVTIYEYARECSPYDEDERTTDDLIQQALDDCLVDLREDIPGLEDADDEDLDEAREWLIEQLGSEREVSDFLEVEVFKSTSDPEHWKVEFLLTCGGPTVRVSVDSRWNSVSLFHSWGYHDHEDRECTEWDICGNNRDEWLEVAEQFVERTA